MHIDNHQLYLSDTETVALPALPYDTVVRVWAVPTDYRANGWFVTTDIQEIPACDHGEPVFEQTLPAAFDAVLAQAKAAKNAQINAWRLEANQSTFAYQGKQFACDLLSRSDIDGVATSINLTGQFPPGFPGAWKAIDNSYLRLNTPADFVQFYQAMTLQGTLNFARAQSLKQALAAAATVEDVNSIAW